eukprot:TRINITY_DN2784_c0_g1_i15.p1 TRINITY_DN2784_c0_g1~~TRINITY_DN2784_c0_g1_i15.p1  ORF type:complete len:349 (-),score=71.40 TRINITY_DN2784_c0_g1_i15:117-1163(-)
MFKSKTSDSILSLENQHLLSKYKDRILAAEDVLQPHSKQPTNNLAAAPDLPHTAVMKYWNPVVRKKEAFAQCNEIEKEMKRREGRIVIPSIEELEAEFRTHVWTTPREASYEKQEQPLSTRNRNLDKLMVKNFASPLHTQMSTNQSEGIVISRKKSQGSADSDIKEVKVLTVPDIGPQVKCDTEKCVENANGARKKVYTESDEVPVREQEIVDRNVDSKKLKEDEVVVKKLEDKNISTEESGDKKDIVKQSKKHIKVLQNYVRGRKETKRIPTSRTKQSLQNTAQKPEGEINKSAKRIVKKSDMRGKKTHRQPEVGRHFTFNALWDVVKAHAEKCHEFKTELVKKGFL